MVKTKSTLFIALILTLKTCYGSIIVVVVIDKKESLRDLLILNYLVSNTRKDSFILTKTSDFIF